MRSLRTIVFCAVALISIASRAQNSAGSYSESNQNPAGPQPSSTSAAQNYFTDTALVNQDGQTVRFYSDLLKDRVVVINSFFTTCTSACPPMYAGLAKVQDSFGEQFGKQLFFISISVDPLVDTPEKLKAFATKFHAKPGWSFLTGEREKVEFILRKLGQYVEDKEKHLIILIIGNEKTGLWKKAFALSKPDELLAVIKTVLDDKGEIKQ